MYCKNCGEEIDDNASFCPNCGHEIHEETKVNTVKNDDTGNFGFGILGFLIPLVGLILFLVWYTDKPQNAKVAGIGALVGVFLEIVLYLISYFCFLGTFY